MSGCRVCGYDYRDYEKIGGKCPRCWMAYEKFCKNLPEGWKRLMGSAHSVAQLPPAYYEWEEEQEIKKNLLDGKITQAEADERAAQLAEKIRRKYNPTEEEWAEACTRIAAQEARAAAAPTVFNTPSLFD